MDMVACRQPRVLGLNDFKLEGACVQSAIKTRVVRIEHHDAWAGQRHRAVGKAQR